MARREPVFFSFHFDNDVMRVQQVRNIGAIEENEPTSPNDWEQIKRNGERAVENWIDNNMSHKRCVIVLVGSETAERKWVKYEIKKAWEDGRGIFGIYIHNLKCPREVKAGRSGTSRKGANPFDQFTINGGTPLSSIINCYDPGTYSPYTTIAENMQSWVDRAIAQRK
jgi:hypothetical protein